jgi:subtilisin family serine protease
MSLLRSISLISFAFATALALSTSHAAGDSPADGRYIVHLESPPAALFDGFADSADPAKRGLVPTHPKTAGVPRLDVSHAAVKAYRLHLAGEQADFQQRAAAKLGRALKPELTLDLVLNAVVLRLSAVEAERLAALPGVSRVEPDFVRTPMSDAGPAWVGAPALWSGAAGVPTRGAGVVVGVIDTGLNAAHPSFAGQGPLDRHIHSFARSLPPSLCASPTSPPCNGKLVALRDFSTGGSSREADNGLDVDGHGSHVAGTAVGNFLRVSVSVAGQPVEREISGVAPHAHLVSYKACEVEAKCLGSWLLAAINSAVADGVDIINYSIGGDPRDPWTSSDALALLAAREAGIIPVVAAGNDGPAQGTVSSPGNSPWVISVANITHDRSIGSRLLDFSGGQALPPGGGSLLGASSTAGYGPARIVFPSDFPACGVGSGLGLGGDGAPDGSSNPWADTPNRFNGEIVVCMRGTQARLAKSDNVRRAGGGGMILLNTVGDGDSIAADAHLVPSTHLGYRAGEQLKAWLFAGGEQARIEGARLIQDPSLGDRLVASSGRGPIDYGGVMLPSIAAPGSSILAAAPTGVGVRTLTGTSMAAPHVAGAAALLRALRPEWRVDEIQSALMLSTRSGLLSEDAVTPARRIDVGAGGLDVAAAARTALVLQTSGADFRAARPATGGTPRQLNLPGLLHERCRGTCSLARSVRDVAGGGRWNASVRLPGGIAEVQPTSFELAAGATQRLEVNVDLSRGADIGQWLDGELRLVRVDAPGELRLPLAVYADPGVLPQRLDLGAVADAGLRVLTLSGLAALTDLTVEAGALTPVVVESRSVASSPATENAYATVQAGAFFFALDLPASTSSAPRRFRLSSELSAIGASSLGLYVGIDYNNNGRPDESEQICVSRSAAPRCEQDLLQTGSVNRVWVMARNESGSGQGASQLELRAALLDPQPSGRRDVVATAPSTVPVGAGFPLRLSWNDPAWLRAERRAFLLSLRARAGAEPFARIPVSLARDTSAAVARPLLESRDEPIRLGPGEARTAFFIDVPSQARRMVLSAIGGSNVRIDVARDPAPGMPSVTPPANLAVVANGASGNPATTEVAAGLLSPGRMWAIVRNVGTETTATSINLRLEAQPLIEPRFGAWYNPERSGAGLFLYRFGTNLGFVWYSYLEDGTPTWYIGSAPASQGERARWSAPLLRMIWNGSSARAVEVGRVVIAQISEERMQFAYELDGQFGSEPLRWLGRDACSGPQDQTLDLNGLWYDARNAGFGYSLDVSADLEVIASFLYDGRGWPRWVLGSGTPFGAGSMDLLQFRGSCPLCAYSPVQSQSVGALQVVYQGRQPVRVDTALDFASPLSGSWMRSHPLTRLSSAVGCPP